MKKIEVVDMLLCQKINDLKKYKPYGNELAVEALESIKRDVIALIDADYTE
ncbi:hypothetical protein [Veillonella sp.]|uniref:hypothetical protein n=1 Tax=Veillonella sp. TaxID=1926307 RepID=UPI0025DC302C|nr:hypothetical protein [Veillonella sp.]